MRPTQIESHETLSFSGQLTGQVWKGPLELVAFDQQEIIARLSDIRKPCFVVKVNDRIGVSNAGVVERHGDAQARMLAWSPPVLPQQLGDANFRRFYGVKYACAAGAMANGIASEEMVIALGRQRLLSSFGAAGLVPSRVEVAIQRIQQALPHGPYAFNLIHSPSEEAIERGAVELFLKHGVTTVEASAFLELTPHIVHYRAAGLSLNAQNQVEIKNRVIAKISRREVARQFMQPAPARILRELVQRGLITELQATLAEKIPVADDITAEADSGGHTDNRPLVSLLPSIIALRDEIQEQHYYTTPIRVGAAGGIGTPAAALATFMMGAAYVVTGSVNQSCVEAGSSVHTKKLLAQADMADVMMAPAADMFEMGVELQVLKRGTFFPMRARKLYQLYREYDSIEAIPRDERLKLEKQVFRKSLDTIWEETVAYFAGRDPEQIERVKGDPKRKMALIFRWYLGLSSRWSNAGEKGREADYQIWCGPSMGAFNAWVRGSYLSEPENRRVVDVAEHLMRGAAFLYRVHSLKLQGLDLPGQYSRYIPGRL